MIMSSFSLNVFHSILVRTSDWENIKPNMPWLLDAAVCVALDLVVSLLIFLQQFLLTQTLNLNIVYNRSYYSTCITPISERQLTVMQKIIEITWMLVKNLNDRNL